MRKLLMITSAILGLGCLYPTTISAQTCTAAPSCADMGYTKTASDCTGKTTLKCPFDLSAVSCEEENLTTVLGQPIILKIQATQDDASFSTLIGRCSSSGGNNCLCSAGGSVDHIVVDCGDGNKYFGNAICTYNKAGEYIYKISGYFDVISGISKTNAYVKEIISLNHPFLKHIKTNICTAETTGPIPNLPPNLMNGKNAFKDCTGLTGNIPTLPTSLCNLTYMFNGCSNLTGTLPPYSNYTTADYTHAFGGTQIENNTTSPWPQSALQQ